MKIIDNSSLIGYNTFGINVTAKRLVLAEAQEELKEAAIKYATERTLVLGGGSNTLFCDNYNGTIIKPNNKGIKIIKEEGNDVYVKAAAGEIWDDFVKQIVEWGLYGAENLSSIPGCVGASPVQNIGAYGAEASQIIQEVHGFYLGTGEPFAIKGENCRFGYRDSIFKNELKNKTIVSEVIYKVQKKGELRLDYGNVKSYVESLGEVNLANIRKAITNIRDSKLPNPAVEGNAGSFFKNPEVERILAETIKSEYPDMPSYDLPNNMVKIPAGWIIEKTGWKGKALGRAAVHDKQALVIVNKGGATGKEIMKLAETIQKDVLKTFGISLDMEVCAI